MIPDAKISTWGYDANVDGFLSSASQNTIHQHAQNLLSDLADLIQTAVEVSSILYGPFQSLRRMIPSSSLLASVIIIQARYMLSYNHLNLTVDFWELLIDYIESSTNNLRRT